jgi:hypothetical protein
MLAAPLATAYGPSEASAHRGSRRATARSSDAAVVRTNVAGTTWRTEANPPRFCATLTLYSPYWKYWRQNRRSDGLLK